MTTYMRGRVSDRATAYKQEQRRTARYRILHRTLTHQGTTYKLYRAECIGPFFSPHYGMSGIWIIRRTGETYKDVQKRAKVSLQSVLCCALNFTGTMQKTDHDEADNYIAPIRGEV